MTHGNWKFSENFVPEFPDHIRRSIPYYAEGHELVCYLSEFFVRDESRVYDLGTATGELLTKLTKHHEHKSNIEWIGVDSESAMLEEAKKNLNTLEGVTLTEDNLEGFEFKPADLIVSYYTIQFVPERSRQRLFDRIYQALNWGGAFIMFEKVRAPDARFQDLMTSVYNDYKERQGFSADQILEKSRQLKGILSPFSTQGNIDLLKRAGFVDYMSVFKYVCFEGFLAIK